MDASPSNAEAVFLSELTKDIDRAARKHKRDMDEVTSGLDGLLFSRQKVSNNTCIPFGSACDGTYTAYSDVDVYVKNTSSNSWARAKELCTHLERRGIKIGSRSDSSCIVPFSMRASSGALITVNAIVERRPEVKDHIQDLRTLAVNYPMYIQLVRFFKTFAAIFVDRFPRRDRPAVLPGSIFYNLSVAMACEYLTPTSMTNASINSNPPALNYLDALKRVCEFIGEGKYDKYRHIYSRYNLSVSESEKENFDKLFRSLGEHLLHNRLPTGMSANPSIDSSTRVALVFQLHKFAAPVERVREERLRKEREEEEKEKEEMMKARLKRLKEEAEEREKLRMTFSRQSLRDYDSDDDYHDDGFIASNGKSYVDYTDYCMSDDYDEDWHSD